MYVNLKQYDNSLYANVDDLTAQWPFYQLNFFIEMLLSRTLNFSSL